VIEYNGTVTTAQPKISFPSVRLSAEGSGEEPQKNGKEIFGVARARYEHGRGAESLRNPSVRFNPKPPRAPRVRSGFAQRLVFHRRLKLLVLKGRK